MTDLEKFEGFMRNYQDMVFSTAVRLLGNEAEAKDIAQTVFLKAFEAFAGLSQSPTAGGWLKKVTTNLCLNQLSRYRFRWRFFSEMRHEEDGPEYVDTLVGPEPAESSLDEADRRALLEAALQKLPNSQRVPLVLYHFDDLPYEEIAEQLGVTLSKVKTDIHRGRRALRKYLGPRLEDPTRVRHSDRPRPVA
jgi:RNA polymerase sigma-70 factor (ECF subfamily)